MTKTIDYFFSIGSPWSYIGFDTFVDLAKDNDVAITPYLTTVVEENGGIFSRNRPEVRRAYWVRDLKRWARVRGKPLLLENRPELSDPAPASLIVIAAFLDGKDWIGLTRALQHAFWAEAQDIGKPTVREAIATAAGLDGATLSGRQADEDVREKWANDRKHAIEHGVFGFPTFRYDSELYWGQDNLPFLERHLTGDRP
ncbi:MULTISPECIES: DsbA family protein [unclassified Rhizobium]|uniref:2-hydroxychromene-2-carboxylate isomerase n=1 Tax=unclassified Rhizobium TaxID=2613769 RepID=UPI0006FF1B0E|nr:MULTISPECIES: DsbA family protein [unclassified Rhizobium]KQV34604.1 2-hydroxychromene-2-carboxylate isomerase [Rhizobium sp. Root1212]KRD23938.1 2-hydroxychromene-2-carboxylate isomerase [Rhizobium sp. Root268]